MCFDNFAQEPQDRYTPLIFNTYINYVEAGMVDNWLEIEIAQKFGDKEQERILNTGIELNNKRLILNRDKGKIIPYRQTI